LRKLLRNLRRRLLRSPRSREVLAECRPLSGASRPAAQPRADAFVHHPRKEAV